MHVAELALAGLMVGTLVGMTGMGGGALMTPLLIFGFGINPTAAVGSDLVASLVMKPVGAAVHHRAGSVRWDLVRWLLPTAVPAAFLGAYLMSVVGDGDATQEVVRMGIGAALIAGVIGMGVQAVLVRRRKATGSVSNTAAPTPLRPAAILVVGLIGGLVVGFTSIGSGSLIIVMLMMLHPRLGLTDLVGTDLVQAIPLVGAATIGHLFFGDIHFGVAFGLLLGAVPGTYFGAKIAGRVPTVVIRGVLCVVLCASAFELLGVPTIPGLVLTALVCAMVVALSGSSADEEVRPGHPGDHDHRHRRESGLPGTVTSTR